MKLKYIWMCDSHGYTNTCHNIYTLEYQDSQHKCSDNFNALLNNCRPLNMRSFSEFGILKPIRYL